MDGDRLDERGIHLNIFGIAAKLDDGREFSGFFTFEGTIEDVREFFKVETIGIEITTLFVEAENRKSSKYHELGDFLVKVFM